ncbi:MAG: transglutaminase domain-containing protein [Bacteroidales bacterium]|nr:transglutaminase domain-containing protein [Bacteroidales bacterium]
MKHISPFFRVRKMCLLIVILLISTSCLKSDKPGLPEEVIRTYSETGFNRIEFTKTIGKFIDDAGDSIQLQAAYFLIAKMRSHYMVTYDVTDTSGAIYQIDPFMFTSGDSLLAHWKKLDSIHGGLHYQPDRFVLDTDTIKSELLISTIQQTMKSQKPEWHGLYDKETVFQYVLPYRIANEAVEDWRSQLADTFPELLYFSAQTYEPDIIIENINEFVNSRFIFDKRFIKQATIQPLADLLRNRVGNYEDLAHLKVKLLRMCGIPATIDYTPYLADSVNSFVWAVAMNSDRKFQPLLSEETKYLFERSNYFPKVYRRIFHENNSSLFRLKPISLTTPPFLGHYDYLDVTQDYVDVIQLQYEQVSPDTLLYLTVLNDKKWRAVDFAISADNQFVFNNIASNITLRPAILNQDHFIFPDEMK